MITFSIFETVFASIVFILYGIVSGILFNALFLIPVAIKEGSEKRSKALYEILKFIFYFAAGIYFICLKFALFDGALRIYTVIIFIAAHIATRALTNNTVLTIIKLILKLFNKTVINPFLHISRTIIKYSKKFQNILFFKAR